MKIFDTFIKLLEKLGQQITTSRDNKGTVITIHDEEYIVKLREKNIRITRDPESKWPSLFLVPNGKLPLKIDRISDTNELVDCRLKLEEQIPTIIATLEVHRHQQRLEAERHERLRAERKRLEKFLFFFEGVNAGGLVE